MDFGVQTFTVRKAQKSDLRSAYLRLSELGTRSLEVARIKFSSKNAELIRAVAEECGIEIASVQVKPKYVFGHPSEIIDFCKRVGCKRVVISMLPFGCILGGEDKFYKFISTLDSFAELYEKEGIALAYHHHNWEYIKLSTGKRRMDELIEKTKKLKFVHDTYWTAGCGIDPVKQIYAFGDRLLGIHLRDLDFKKQGIKVKNTDAAIGEGVVRFDEVLVAAERVGCSYYVIEQNTKEPFSKIEKSFKALCDIRDRIENKEC